MSPRLRRTRAATVLAIALASGASGFAAQAAPNLFSDPESGASASDRRIPMARMADLQARRTVRASRMVDIDTSILASGAADAPTTVTLNLFPDAGFRAHFDRLERRGADDVIWHGRLDGPRMGTAKFVVNNGRVTGAIRTGDETFMVESLAGGRHAITRIDHTQFPQDHPAVPGGHRALLDRRFLQSLPAVTSTRDVTPALCATLGATDCLTEIKVIAAYTSSAGGASGGNAPALIDLAVSEANDSYRNSGINIRLTLVHKYQTSYRESGNWSTDLSRFRIAGDAQIDEIQALRTQYGADVAVLVLHNPSACGLASSILAGKATAFAAVHWECAAGNYSFAHEIGHLQGARHNPEADPTATPFAHGHGYVFPQGSWRTIMAYADSRCADGACKRVPYWSNPNVIYPCGTNPVACAPMGTTTQHDNARVLNDTAGTVSGFVP